MDEADCSFFWGSHGCMHERGHVPPHECGDDLEVHSQHDGLGLARLMGYAGSEDDAPAIGWGDWMPWKPFGADAHGPTRTDLPSSDR